MNSYDFFIYEFICFMNSYMNNEFGCTKVPDVIPCLSQVSSDWPKDIPGIILSSAYTLYKSGINPDKQSYPTVSRFQMRMMEFRFL